jgi:hypothetical protein
MISRTTARRQLGAAALAAMAAAFVVSPAGATSRDPAGECPPGQRDLIAVQRKLVSMVAPVQKLRLLAHTKQVRKVLETRLAEAGRLQDAIRFEVELAEITGLESLRAAVWMDRDLDAMKLLAERDRHHLDFELDSETAPRASHPVTAAIDVLVGLARLPASASLVVQHLLGAFAKVTPRVARALF